MHFSYHPRGTFSALNEKLAVVLQVPSDKNQARAYPNCVHALLETAIGYFQTFSMKKKFYYFKDLDPHFELAVTALSKLGFEGKALSLDQFSKDFAWAETLDRESGIVFWSEDHPITGEIYDTSELLKKVGEKNTFRIRLSHNKHLYEELVPTAERNEIRILQMPAQYLDGCAIAIMGERGRLGAVTAEALSPTTSERIGDLASAIAAKKVFCVPIDLVEITSKIRDFESTKIDQLRFFFTDKPAAPRLFDRVVFSFENIDGQAFLSFLALELGAPLKDNDPRFETSSLSRWGGLRTMKWLESQGLSPNTVRGLCVVDSGLLDDQFSAKFASAHQKVLKAQNGHG